MTTASDIGGGSLHNCAVQEGRVSCWGWINADLDFTSGPTELYGVDGVVQVDGGNYQVCAVDSTGTVSCIGTSSTFDTTAFVEIDGF